MYVFVASKAGHGLSVLQTLGWWLQLWQDLVQLNWMSLRRCNWSICNGLTRPPRLNCLLLSASVTPTQQSGMISAEPDDPTMLPFWRRAVAHATRYKASLFKSFESLRIRACDPSTMDRVVVMFFFCCWAWLCLFSWRTAASPVWCPVWCAL